MAYKDEEFMGKMPDDFILDITRIPGNSNEITLFAINYYNEKLKDPELAQPLKDIAQAFVFNLTEYYEMSNFESQKLREALPFLSESARFIESKDSPEVDLESTARIKSFYSTYQKILDLTIDAISKNIPIPKESLLKDIYATRDILSPRYDMRTNPQAFYKLTYQIILDYMEFIESKHAEDPRFYLVPFDEAELNGLLKPQKIRYSPQEVFVPEQDFFDYALAYKGVPSAYRYLADINNLDSQTIEAEIARLKTCDLSNPESYSNSLIYAMINSQVQKDSLIKLATHFDTYLFNEFEKKNKAMYSDYRSLPWEEFFKEYEHNLTSYTINCCQLLNHIRSNSTGSIFNTSELPTFSNNAFVRELITQFNHITRLQSSVIEDRLKALQDLDTTDFQSKLETAKKVKAYSRCGKDYMKHPKGNGYQSYHIRIQTPYGIVEKQFRTEAQDIVAEKGLASHSNDYKPNVRNTFHRLKVPTPLSPKRDENGDLIYPIELGILPFEQAVAKYYGAPFSVFSGKTFEEFKNQFNTKQEFDEALLALSPTPTTNKFFAPLVELFSRKKAKPEIKIENTNTDSGEFIENIPTDIAVYATTNPNSKTTQGNPDPHDNR